MTAIRTEADAGKLLRHCYNYGNDSIRTPFPELEFQQAAKFLVSSICKDWRSLKDIVERHEPTLRRRWLKKCPKKRRELLLRAWPRMPVHHRPDLWSIWHKGDQRTLGVPSNECFWPYINHEDLTLPGPLPIFLNARGRNHPNSFALSELHLSPWALVNRAKLYQRWPEVLMGFTGRAMPDNYGQIVTYSNPEEAKAAERDGQGCHPGEGFAILWIQTWLYKFLVRCSLLILHDIPNNQMFSDLYPVQDDPRGLVNYGYYNTVFTAMAVLLPYHARTTLDLGRLRYLVSASYESAKDHLWSLREDPGYFVEILQGILNRPMHHLPGKGGPPQGALATALKQLVCETYSSLVMWEPIYGRFLELHTLSLKYPEGIHPNNASPEDVDTLVLAWALLEDGQDVLKNALVHDFVGSPTMRPEISSIPGTITIDGSYFVNAYALRAFQLVADMAYGTGHITDMYASLDALDYISRCEPNIKGWYRARVNWALAQLSAITECLFQFRMQPWAKSLEVSMQKKREEIEDGLLPSHDWIYVLSQGETIPAFDSQLETLGNPSGGQFHYPVHERRCRRTVEAMRKSEKNLDNFWMVIDRFYEDKKNRVARGAVLDLLKSMHGRMYGTEPWVSRERKGSQAVESEYVPLTHLSSQAITTTAPKPSGQTGFAGSKEKVKKRKDAEEQGDKVIIPDENTTDPPEPVVFLVDKASLKVFQNIFHVPNGIYPSGKLRWRDFVSALTKIGFSAEKIYGSVWQFSPVDVPSLGPKASGIHFHEPHPDPVIPLRMARKFGRRLHKAYGWTGSSFQVKQGN